MSNWTVSDVLAAWGAILSTALGLGQFVSWLRSKASDLTVRIEHGVHLHGREDATNEIAVVAVNRSDYAVRVVGLGFSTDRSVGELKYVGTEISPHDRARIRARWTDVTDVAGLSGTRIRAIVELSTGEVFKSKYLKLATVKQKNADELVRLLAYWREQRKDPTLPEEELRAKAKKLLGA